MTRAEFIERWQTRLIESERLGGSVDGAKVCREVLADFEAVTTTEDQQLVDLPRAAQVSGYSEDRLRKLAKAGKVQVVKRKRRLFFPVGALPKRPPSIDAPGPREYDAGADARQVATLLKESHHG